MESKPITAGVPAQTPAQASVPDGAAAAGTLPYAFLKGDKGEKGEKGDKGDKGDKGERGEKGERGQDAAASSWSVTETLAVDEENVLFERGLFTCAHAFSVDWPDDWDGYGIVLAVNGAEHALLVNQTTDVYQEISPAEDSAAWAASVREDSLVVECFTPNSFTADSVQVRLRSVRPKLDAVLAFLSTQELLGGYGF